MGLRDSLSKRPAPHRLWQSAANLFVYYSKVSYLFGGAVGLKNCDVRKSERIIDEGMIHLKHWPLVRSAGAVG